MSIENVAVRFRLSENGLMNGGGGGVPRRTILRYRSKKIAQITLRAYNAAARRQCRSDHHEAVDMKKRHQIETTISAAEFKYVNGVVGGDREVCMSQRH